MRLICAENIKIENIELSVRSYNCLKKTNINTLEELINLDDSELIKIRNLGKKSLEELRQIIHSVNNGVIPFKKFESDINGVNIYEMRIIDSITNSTKEIENILFYDEQNGYFDELLISDLNLSVRAFNALNNSGFTSLSQLLNATLYDFEAIKSLGQKSKDEILSIIKQKVHIIYKTDQKGTFNQNVLDETVEIIINEFEESSIEFNRQSLRSKLIASLRRIDMSYHESVYPKELLLIKEYIYKLYGTEFFRCFLEGEIVKLLNEQVGIVKFSTLNSLFPKHISETKLILNLVNDMVSEKILEDIDNGYRVYYKTLEQAILDLEDERDRIIITNRLQGKTLEEVGKLLNVTRERIRQKEMKAIKKIPRVREDDFEYIFQKYEWNKDIFLTTFNVDIKVFNYLNTKYKNGNIDLKEALADHNIPIKSRQKIENYIYKDYLLIGNSRVKKDRQEILDYVLKFFCKDDVSVEELSEYYTMFLEDYDLDEDEYKFPIRYFESTLANSLRVIWKFKRKLRYFDFSEFDEEKIISTLALENYKNLEISSLKIFNDYIDIMKEWDIRDEYELHNLMKKIIGDNNCYGIKFLRMPNIEFGTADRDMQVLELFIQSSPIENVDLAKLYEKEYGVKWETVLANHFKVIEEYYHNGKYSMDYKCLDKNELDEMKRILNDDIYLLSEVKDLYKKYFPSGDITTINPYSLRALGFKVTALFVYSDKYNSLDHYFKKIVVENEIFDANLMTKRFANYQSFYNVMHSMKSNYDIIEFEPNVYISFKRLEKIGVNKDDILDFIKCVDNFINEEIFTVKLLKNRGFEHYLFDLGFDDWFYSCILRCNERFRSRRVEKNIILKKCNDFITINDLVEHVVSKFRKIDIYELVDYVYENYGVKINRGRITTIVADKELYYDAIMEKVYIDYDEYFEEV